MSARNKSAPDTHTGADTGTDARTGADLAAQAPDGAADNQGSGHPEEYGLPLKPGLLKRRVGYRVRLMQSVLADRVVPGFTPYEMRPGSFTTMALMQANPGRSQAELARAGGLDKSAIVTIVDELENRGLAVRGRSREDRRRNALFLTPRGEELTTEMASVAHGSEEPLREALSAKELETLLALLDRAYLALAGSVES